MNYEREDYMRRQDAEHDMIRMRDPSRSLVSRPVAAPKQPSHRAAAFRNMFAILHNLEASELSFLTAEQRWAFFRDPIPAILRLDDARLDALYALVQERQPARYRH